MRVVWFVILGLWGALNLFYWPFWLAQADKSMRTTYAYANCGRFLLLNFLPVLVLLLVVAVLTFVSVQTTVPFGVGLMVWVTLIAETAVAQSLEHQA